MREDESTTTRRPFRRPPRLHRRGTAMMEFALTVPFLAIILGLTFFFGWTFMHKHQVVVANRYAAWQRVENRAWPSGEKLNELFFADRAADVQCHAMGMDRWTAEDLVDEAGAQGRRTETLAQELLMDRFPGGHRAHVAAQFGTHRALWEQFRGHIHDSHGREGITWRRDEVNCWYTLRDQYCSDLDAALQRVPQPGAPMAQIIRRLYLVHW